MLYVNNPISMASPRLLHLSSHRLLRASPEVISVRPIFRADDIVLVLVVLVILIFIFVLASVLTCWDPRVPVIKRGVLTGKIMAALGPRLDVVTTSCREGSRAHRELGADSSLLCDPVGKSVFTILDDGLASLISIVSRASLARGHWSVVDKLKQMLAIACNDGHLLAMFAQRIELICVGGLDLLTCDVRELSLSYQGFGFGADEFLFEDNNFGRIGLLVLELGDLVCDLLLAYQMSVCWQR